MSPLQDSDEDAQIVRYLLDRLPEEVADQLEERYFCDAAYFERVGAVEDSLIRQYLDGFLSASDAMRFEQKARRVPEIRKKVEIELALRKEFHETVPPMAKDGATRFGAWFHPTRVRFAFIALTLVSISLWLLRSFTDGGARPESQVLAFALEPGLEKGQPRPGNRRFVLGQAVTQVRITLELPGLAGQPRVDVEAVLLGNSSRRSVLTQRDLPTSASPEGSTVVFAAASADLPMGDYILYVRLTGQPAGQDIESFVFSLLPP